MAVSVRGVPPNVGPPAASFVCLSSMLSTLASPLAPQSVLPSLHCSIHWVPPNDLLRVLKNKTKQNKGVALTLAPHALAVRSAASFHGLMLSGPLFLALVLWAVEHSLGSGPWSSQEDNPPIAERSLFTLNLPPLKVGSVPLTTSPFLPVSRCFLSFLDICLLFSWR